MVLRRCGISRLSKPFITAIACLNLLCVLTLYNVFTQPVNLPSPLRHQHGDGGGGDGLVHVRPPGVIVDYEPSSPCPNLQRPHRVEEQDRWRTVVKDGTYVYSAFYDDRQSPNNILIIGMSSGESPKKICQIWYKDKLVLSPAKYDIVPETHGTKYAPSMHTCIADQQHGIPEAVSLVLNSCDKANHALKVHNRHEVQQDKYNFTVCTTPLNNNFSNYHQFVDIVEANRVLGAQQFVFYDYIPQHTAALDPYLEYYKKIGVATVLPWDMKCNVDHMDSFVQPEIHYYGQLVALHDCLYRNMFSSKYIIFTDIDEVIVPKKVSSWTEMMHSFSKKSEYKRTGAWIFLNAFFRLEFDNDKADGLKEAEALKINSLLKTKRESRIWPSGSRSKILVKPEMVTMTGIHFIYRFLDPHTQTYTVDSDDALLHHYRIGFDDTLPPSEVDRTMHKHIKRLTQSVRTVKNAVKNL